MTDLAAALLRDVPRYALSAYDEELERQIDGPFVHYHEVLAALSRALDAAIAEQAGEALEGVTDGPWKVEYKHGTTRLMMGDSCQMCDETYYPWVPTNERDWHFIAAARELVPALLAQNAALRAERDETLKAYKIRLFSAEAERDALRTERDKWMERCGRERAFASSHRIRAEAAEAQNAALTARVEELTVAGIEAYYARQVEWSRETFGPALRTKGIIDHITKELREIAADPHDLSEWIDVVILAMDGFWRHGGKPEDLMPALLAKQAKNMARTWPDWRGMSEDAAIEHDRSKDAALSATTEEGHE